MYFGGEVQVTASPPPFMSAAECREKEIECRQMSMVLTLAPARRIELAAMANDWARLAVAQEL